MVLRFRRGLGFRVSTCGLRLKGYMGGYLGMMQKKMETTAMGYIGFRVWGLYRAYKGIWGGVILG